MISSGPYMCTLKNDILPSRKIFETPISLITDKFKSVTIYFNYIQLKLNYM